jgi:hypothetical protein
MATLNHHAASHHARYPIHLTLGHKDSGAKK